VTISANNQTDRLQLMNSLTQLLYRSVGIRLVTSHRLLLNPAGRAAVSYTRR